MQAPLRQIDRSADKIVASSRDKSLRSLDTSALRGDSEIGLQTFTCRSLRRGRRPTSPASSPHLRLGLGVGLPNCWCILATILITSASKLARSSA